MRADQKNRIIRRQRHEIAALQQKLAEERINHARVSKEYIAIIEEKDAELNQAYTELTEAGSNG